MTLALAFRERYPRAGVRLHPHSARGAGLANVLAALEVGIDRFDASVGGGFDMGGSDFDGDGKTPNGKGTKPGKDPDDFDPSN